MRLLAKARWFGLGGWSKIYWLLHNVDILPACFQSCKNVPTVPTSWCYFFWPVLIFGKYTRKTGENTRKEAKNRAILVLNFLWEKLVGANFYAFCNYGNFLQPKYWLGILDKWWVILQYQAHQCHNAFGTKVNKREQLFALKVSSIKYQVDTHAIFAVGLYLCC